MIKSTAVPGASVDTWVPNRSRAINNSPISCGVVGSDVARRTSVQVRVRTDKPGALWFWYRAIGQQACGTRSCQAL